MSDSAIARDNAQFGSFRSCAATHAGTANRLNEDAYVNRPDLGLWAVADGAGGHESGEIASAEVASLLQTIDPGLPAGEMLVEVRSRLEAAHARLHTEASRHGAGAMVATTVVVLLARDDHFACLWAGDSRAYLLRGQALTKITRDHSLVQVLVENGTLSEEDAARHPQANVITRAVGADIDLLELDKRTGQLMAGDRLLLCSDGLSKTLPEGLLAELLSGDDETAAERLVTAALMAQVTDNVTAVIVDVGAADRSTALQARGADAAALPISPAAQANPSADEHLGTAQDDGATVGGHIS
jgi:protein phosphatase/serine/threonine-protein phosphatase Stp1